MTTWHVLLEFEVHAVDQSEAEGAMVQGTLCDGPEEAERRLRGAVVDCWEVRLPEVTV
jgi:hypothetical protein